jgi:hypothetical protein
MNFKMHAIKGSKSVVFKLGKQKHVLMTRRKENFKLNLEGTRKLIMINMYSMKMSRIFARVGCNK